MFRKPWLAVAVIALAAGVAPPARAGDVRIKIPKRSLETPVQKLNRQGVDAIRKHKYEKAKALFYQAYLYDPDDPFTLNNLGYVSELEGQVDRAQRFYELAAKQAGDAIIDQSNKRQVEGQPVSAVVNSNQNGALGVDRTNLEAMRLLAAGRARDAEALLQQSRRERPADAFTLNNLGVAKQIEGDAGQALQYYNAAAGMRSSQVAVVTRSDAWRGRPVSDMAAENARRLSRAVAGRENPEVQAAYYNLLGVAALNHNNTEEARRDFQKAYALDKANAFSLNNLGYIAELDGDWETAQSYYDEAQKANRANARVGTATRPSAEGMKLEDVASDNSTATESRMAAAQAARQRQQGPIVLKRRDNKPVDPPNQ